ncbi:MAG: membrane protein insertase YidC [Kiritimatiellales bacterium]|nr:membrane protein insertase YidC [Kiritimatiellales bacterium]
MKKNDFIIVGILVVLMFGWMRFYPALEKKYFPKPEQPVEQTAPAEDAEVVAPVLSEPVDAVVEKAAEAAAEAVAEVAAVEMPDVPEAFQTLSNETIELTLSSYGGAVVSAVLKDYPERNTDDSGPVVLDFASAPALRYDGLALTAGTFSEIDGGFLYTTSLGSGRLLKRTLRLEGEYLLTVQDEFINASDVPWALPELRLPTGPMSNAEGTSAMKGVTTLGIDTFAPAIGVSHWGKKFRKMQKGVQAFSSASVSAEIVNSQPVDWIAAKSKFFVQILTPEEQGTATGFDFFVRRDGEGKKMEEAEVSGALLFDPELIGADETFTRTVRTYIGPKDFGFLKTQGMEQTEVMEFKSTGMWKFMNPVMYPIKKALLWGLIHFAVFGSYGIAILILTVIVRVIFWPLTHKSTESMKRMQALQPQMAAIKEKHKDNPQLMQQKTMALYKENKVNPMGGCLPMFVQIPVFIALFAVLRSAIELRYSSFLWINDLSEPENLFAGMVPVVGSLNILPILMAATMMWQQKLTTGANAAATPEQKQQQKMMAVMMPIMMLFFFYSMPSGLVLYWTTSQVLMIAQLLMKKKKEA